MIFSLRAKPNPGTVIQPQSAASGLLLRHLHALRLPDSLHPLVIHQHPFVPDQARDPRRPVSTVCRRQLDDPLRQPVLILTNQRKITLRRTGLTQYRARPPLGNTQMVHHVLDRLALPLRAQKFGRAASRRIALSNSASATSRLRRAFSRSSSLSRMA